MRKRIKASLTVEASFVITMTILVIGIMLSLWIYKFQLCWYTQAVDECLLTGSNYAVLDEENYINLTKLKWESVKEQNYLEPQNLTEQIDGDDDKICMKVNGNTPSWGDVLLKINIEQNIDIIKPVKFIRKISTVKEAFEK